MTPKAIEAFQRALRIDPEFAAAWPNLGNAYEAGQSAEAIEAYQQALRIDPEDANAWYNLGLAYAKAGQSTKASRENNLTNYSSRGLKGICMSHPQLGRSNRDTVLLRR